MKEKSMTSVVARLHRAGSEHSSMVAKLRNATDQLAKHLADLIDFNEMSVSLPRGVCLEYPSNSDQYELKWYYGERQFSLTDEHKSRKDLLAFAQLVAEGWISEVSAWLESEGKQMRSAAEAIELVLNDGKEGDVIVCSE